MTAGLGEFDRQQEGWKMTAGWRGVMLTANRGRERLLGGDG